MGSAENKRSFLTPKHTDLVRLVIILGVVFKDLRLFRVLESSDQIVRAEFVPPLLAVNEPGIVMSQSGPRYSPHF